MMENSNMYMPVAPANNGDGMFGGSWMWFLLVWMAMFGWGNGGFGGNNGDLQRGFDQASLTNGINNIQTALCNGFAGVSNGFAQAEISANARQMADMNQSFAIQQGIGNLQYAVATEACADRNAIATALRDVLEANNASTQRILDVMCQDRLDAKNETIALLRQQVEALQNENGRNAQTATLLSSLAPVPKPAYVVANPNGCGCGTSCGCGTI